MIVHPPQSIHVLGSGSMGLLWAGYLAEQGFEVTLITRNEFPATSHGSAYASIEVSSTGHNIQAQVKLQLISSLKQLNPQKICRLVIAVKSHQVLNAVSSIINHINSETCLIMLQNGRGAEEELLRSFPQLNTHQLFHAISTHGALKEATTGHSLTTSLPGYKVIHTGHGETWLGNLNSPNAPMPKKLIEFLKNPLINGWVENIEQKLWQKLIINASINPLTALLNCRNGELLKADFIGMIEAIADESIQIANAYGQQLDANSEKKRIIKVAEKTALNYSSMQQDIQFNRQTEILYINGYLVKSANKVSLLCPINKMLTQMVQFKSQLSG